MKLTALEETEFSNIIKDHLENKRVLKMDEFSQHGSITTYAHCFRVARFCFWMNRRLKLKSNERVLLSGAMLHDMFLYDWHIIGSMNPYHATNHAELACRNAIRYCGIDEKTQSVIRSHMWPLNITKVPQCREAVIVCIADKYCSLMETLLARKGMKKHGKKR